tara:strand:- start:29 stop:271 length:243 start_codon:yes stop_codon:yes gene_type:complete
MTVPKVIDKRVVWLDGLSLHAAEVLKKLKVREINGITPSEAEKEIVDLCGGFLYLLELSKEYGLFDSEDPFNLFEQETLH